MINQINLPKDKDLAKKVLDNHGELERKRTEQGILGNIWGSSSSIPNNLTALSVILLMITGIVYTFCLINKPLTEVGLSIKDFWAIITPLITLAVGYLFGDKSKKEEV